MGLFLISFAKLAAVISLPSGSKYLAGRLFPLIQLCLSIVLPLESRALIPAASRFFRNLLDGFEYLHDSIFELQPEVFASPYRFDSNIFDLTSAVIP